jgi:FkbM family methyltransferase
MNKKKIRRQIAHTIEELFPFFFYGKFSYSQDGEDMMIKSFYEHKKDNKGFYVDVGAHHPYRFSNTAYFYKRGWRGINIEPTTVLFKNFIRHRKHDINLNIAISNTNEPLTFYQFDEPALNSLDEKLSLERHENTKYKIIKKDTISSFKLSEVLEKYMPEKTKIDFLTIDVEGFDLEVLKSNDWDKFIPDFILIECDCDSFQDMTRDNIYSFLKELSYELVGRSKRTSIFRHISKKDAV